MRPEQFDKAMLHALKTNLEHGGAPTVPAGGVLLWQWFLDLSAARSYHAAGPNPVSFLEIEAFARLHRLPLEPRHVDILRRMDGVFLSHFHAGRHDDGARPKVKPSGEISAAAFDAVFG